MLLLHLPLRVAIKRPLHLPWFAHLSVRQQATCWNGRIDHVRKRVFQFGPSRTSLSLCHLSMLGFDSESGESQHAKVKPNELLDLSACLLVQNIVALRLGCIHMVQ